MGQHRRKRCEAGELLSGWLRFDPAVLTEPLVLFQSDIEGIGTVYRYEGYANFTYQMTVANRMMIEHCKAANGGRPIFVKVQKNDLGMVVLGVVCQPR